jgi:hypothetical protein
MNKAIVQKQKYRGAFACFWALFIGSGPIADRFSLGLSKGFFLVVCVTDKLEEKIWQVRKRRDQII